jgi:hypothetical protein
VVLTEAQTNEQNERDRSAAVLPHRLLYIRHFFEVFVLVFEFGKCSTSARTGIYNALVTF